MSMEIVQQEINLIAAALDPHSGSYDPWLSDRERKEMRDRWAYLARLKQALR